MIREVITFKYTYFKANLKCYFRTKNHNDAPLCCVCKGKIVIYKGTFVRLHACTHAYEFMPKCVFEPNFI